MKTCPHCKTEKKLDDFYLTSKNGKRGQGSWCKECMKEAILKRQRKYKQTAIDMKGGCCQSCGFDKYIGALEFHHLNPRDKDAKINRISRNPETDFRIRKELEKCILLCANCHRMAHAGLIECSTN